MSCETFNNVIMTTRRELSEFERGMVVGARRMGHSISEVVDTLKISRSTVSRVYREYLMEGITTHKGQRSGRPRLLNDRDQRRLSRSVRADRRTTLRELTTTFNEGSTRSVSVRTVQRNLALMGYGSRRPTRVPLLTAHHRRHRITWARDHMQWSLDDWKTVAWSDESRFQLVRADGRVRVWRKPHEAMDPTCQQGTVQAGGGSIMVWGVFTWHGLGPLVKLNQSLTGKRYVELLGDNLQPFMDFSYPNNDGMFQDDNAPCHRAHIVRDWFEEHSGQFQHMVWPPRSPDMNPLEHIWDMIERAIRAQDSPPTTISQLWAAIDTVWRNISPGDFRRLVESMPRRVAALRRARGGPTRY